MESETKINYGFIAPEIKEEDFVLGGGNVPFVLLQKDGQWDNFIDQLEERQRNAFMDSFGCTGYGLENHVVSYMKRRYGINANYSERAIGIIAGTFPPGNSPDRVYQKNREVGFINQELLPFNNDIKTPEEFYSPSPLTDELLEEAKKWNQEYELFHEWAWRGNPPLEEKINNMKMALKYSPLGLAVYAWATDENGNYIKLGPENHWVCVYGYTDKGWKVYDSYDNSHKIYSFENEVNYCKRISIEKREQKPTTDMGNAIINFIKRLFAKFKFT